MFVNECMRGGQDLQSFCFAVELRSTYLGGLPWVPCFQAEKGMGG